MNTERNCTENKWSNELKVIMLQKKPTKRRLIKYIHTDDISIERIECVKDSFTIDTKDLVKEKI